MTDYCLTGHKGAGKTLIAVGMAQKYLRRGRRVAANITLRPEHLVKAQDRSVIFKLPGFPRHEDLQLLGRGYEGPYDESKFGLVILDEAGSWLNSHDWKDPDRRGLFHWLTHARKLGWDVVLIIQDWESLDGQTRRSITELYTGCSRLDRIKFLGIGLPKIHLATHRYKGPSGIITGRDFYTGNSLYSGYDTTESVIKDLNYTDVGPIDARGCYTLLSAWHLKGRYMTAPEPWWLLAWKIYAQIFIGLLIVLLTPIAAIERLLGGAPVGRAAPDRKATAKPAQNSLPKSSI